jgi:beta-galactosidase/beta-glucuronidase
MQAQRLSWHPSVALWCGNNEVDLSYEWSNSTVLRSNRNMFAVDYQAVFIDTVRKNIKQVRVCTWRCPVSTLLFQPPQLESAFVMRA